jgi:hypothetical protein
MCAKRCQLNSTITNRLMQGHVAQETFAMIDKSGEKRGREGARLAHAFMAKHQRMPSPKALDSVTPSTAARPECFLATSTTSEHWFSLHADCSHISSVA